MRQFGERDCIDSAVARLCGLGIVSDLFLGLTPQALCYRPLRGLGLNLQPVEGPPHVRRVVFVIEGWLRYKNTARAAILVYAHRLWATRLMFL